MSDEQENPTENAPQNRARPDDANRQDDGRFGPGNRANAGGRPKALKEVQDEAALYTTKAIKTLVDIIDWAMAKPSSARAREARQAAVALLDRAWGKPAQPIGGVPGQPVGLDMTGAGGVLDVLKKIAGEE